MPVTGKIMGKAVTQMWVGKLAPKVDGTTILYVGCSNAERTEELMALFFFLTSGLGVPSSGWVPMRYERLPHMCGMVTVIDRYKLTANSLTPLPVMDKVHDALVELDDVVLDWKEQSFMGYADYGWGTGMDEPARTSTPCSPALLTSTSGILTPNRLIHQLTPTLVAARELLKLASNTRRGNYGSQQTTSK